MRRVIRILRRFGHRRRVILASRVVGIYVIACGAVFILYNGDIRAPVMSNIHRNIEELGDSYCLQEAARRSIRIGVR